MKIVEIFKHKTTGGTGTYPLSSQLCT